MRSVALSFLALAASGALAQSADAPKPTFTVSDSVLGAIALRANLSVAYFNQGFLRRTVHRRLVRTLDTLRGYQEDPRW